MRWGLQLQPPLAHRRSRLGGQPDWVKNYVKKIIKTHKLEIQSMIEHAKGGIAPQNGAERPISSPTTDTLSHPTQPDAKTKVDAS